MAKMIISLSDELLEATDSYCKKFRYNRSEFVRHAIREIIKYEMGVVRYEDTRKTKKNG
jgi:metal-responsive CopG/Arc/MetJ family transcriptional regulator